jgi:hypothetical protein
MAVGALAEGCSAMHVAAVLDRDRPVAARRRLPALAPSASRLEAVALEPMLNRRVAHAEALGDRADAESGSHERLQLVLSDAARAARSWQREVTSVPCGYEH